METGRVDAAAREDGWLVSRVTSHERRPTLTLTALASDGSKLAEENVVSPVGGYPRMAVIGGKAVVVFTEPAGAGNSRVGMILVPGSPKSDRSTPTP